MRLRTKLLIAWGSMMLLLWAATLWPMQHIIATNFARVADEGFAGTRRSLDAVQAERLKQMRQACWLVMNIPELRALIAEESSELAPENLQSLTERLDSLSDMVGVDLVCVLDNRGALIAQNHRSPWSSLDALRSYISDSSEATALVRHIFASTSSSTAAPIEGHDTHGLWADQRQLYQVVGVPLLFGDANDDSRRDADGALIMATMITDALTADLGKGHNCEITFLTDGRAVASTFPAPARGELESHYQSSHWQSGQAFETTIAGIAYRSWLAPVQDPCSGARVGAMLVQTSLADLQAAQGRVSRVMLAILISGLFAVALASFLLSGAVTRPVGKLVEGVRKVADGDLDQALRATRRDELGELAGAFNEMVSQLRTRRQLQKQVEESQAASRAKSQFLANMSHEIRTPLNGVVGLTQLLLVTPLNDRQRRYTDLIKTSANVLTTLINDVLDFSKIEAGKMDLESISFSPHSVVEEAVELLAAKAHRKGLEIACDVGVDVPRALRGDPNRVRQILINLVSNAIKFTEAGEVIVKASCESRSDDRITIKFSISDTGIGIPPERRDRLFQSFSQVDASTTRKHGGTGLGLAISKQLAELMSGSIGVESEPGRGSTFWFTAWFQSAPDPGGHGAPQHELKSLRVAIAEPHPRVADIAKRRLEEWGVQTTTAPSAQHLRSVLEGARRTERPFNLVLVADQLSRPNAQELAAFLKRAAGDADLNLVLVVKSDHALDDSQLAHAGFSSYVTKPLARSKLEELLLHCVDPSATTRRAGRSPIQQSNRRAGTHPSRSARILLAEDNDVNQLVLVDMLANAGYHCDVVADGVSVVEAIGAGDSYDLVLMDCQMPRMDGFEATRIIRQRERTAHGAARRVPIIALTASAVRGDRQRCLDAGMDGYCTKPIEADLLIRTIESFLQPSTRANDASQSMTDSPENTMPTPTKPLDFEALLRRCAGKPELAHRVVAALASKISESIAGIQRCLEANDHLEIARLAHGVKGAAGMAAASPLQQAATKLEEVARAGELDMADKSLASFRDQARQCEEFIQTSLQLMATGTMNVAKPSER